MDKIQILSTKQFLQECLEDEIFASDFYEFVENKTQYQQEQLKRLKYSFLQFKFKILESKLPEIQNSELYKSMEENGETIPLMGSLSKLETTGINDPRLHKICNAELPDFIDKFLNLYFVHIDKFEIILDDIIETKAESVDHDIQNSSIKFLGTDLQFVELVKAMIEMKIITGKSEKVIFSELGNFLKLPEVNKKQKLETIKARTSNTTPLLDDLSAALNNWSQNVN